MPHGQITKCTDKLPGLINMINKAGAKIGKRGRFAGGRAGLLKSAEKLELLRKVDSRKVLCAALVKARTSVKNN